MKRILLAVALLLLAVTATNAAPPARHGGRRSAPTVQRTPQSAAAKGHAQARGTTTGQSAQAGGLPSQAAAPLRLDDTGGVTFNPGPDPTGAFGGQLGNGGIPAASGQQGGSGQNVTGGVATLPNFPSGQQPDAIIQGVPIFFPTPPPPPSGAIPQRLK
jgi:hypothetical protein